MSPDLSSILIRNKCFKTDFISIWLPGQAIVCCIRKAFIVKMSQFYELCPKQLGTRELVEGGPIGTHILMK